MSRRIQPLSIVLFVADLGVVLLGLFEGSRLRSMLPIGRGGALSEAIVEVPWFVYMLALVCWAVGMVSSDAYNPHRVLRWFNEAWRVVWGSVLAVGLFAGTLYMVYRELSRLQFLYSLAITLTVMLSYRAALRMSYRLIGKSRPGSRSRVLIVGAGELGEKVGRVVLDHSRWGFELTGFLDDSRQKQASRPLGAPVLGTLGDAARVVEQNRVTEVWVALPMQAESRLAELVTSLERSPVIIKVVPDYYSLAMVQAKPEILGGIPLIGLREPLIEGTTRLVKRLFDLVATLLLLIPALPLMGILAVLIRLDSRGPALFKQERVGENGRLFEMYKFRSMRAGAGGEPTPPDDSAVWPHKRKGDPRVTRVGRGLRRLSLDELPQLFNVLKGEMSLVGPRPEMPWLVDRYESWQRKRFAVPPGLTGWWQINGRSDKPMHLNTQDDLYYVYNYSIWLDLWILIRTPFSVISGQGAF